MRRNLALAIFVLTAAALVPSLPAANPAWGNVSGNFTNTTLWSTAAAPTAGDTAWLTNNVNSLRTVSNNSTTTYGNLVISNSGSNTMKLLLVSNGVMTVSGSTVLGKNALLSFAGSGTVGGVMTNGSLTMLDNAQAALAPNSILAVSGSFSNTSGASIELGGSTTSGGAKLAFIPDAVVTNNGTISFRHSNANPYFGTLSIGGTNLLLNRGILNMGIDTRLTTGIITGGLGLVSMLVNEGQVLLTNAVVGTTPSSQGRHLEFTVLGKSGTAVTNAAVGTWKMVGSYDGVYAVISNGGFVTKGVFSSDVLSTNGVSLPTSNFVTLLESGATLLNDTGGQLTVGSGSLLVAADRIVNAGTTTVNGVGLSYQGGSGANAAINNTGLLILNGGTLGVSGTMTNAVGGQIQGALTNAGAGMVFVNRGSMSNSNLVNAGVLNYASGIAGLSQVSGGTIDLRPTDPAMSISLINPAGATVQSTNGLGQFGGNLANSGTLKIGSAVASTFSNANLYLNDSGAISFAGASGGARQTLVVGGVFTNSATSTISTPGSAVMLLNLLFNGMSSVTNNGTMSVYLKPGAGFDTNFLLSVGAGTPGTLVNAGTMIFREDTANQWFIFSNRLVNSGSFIFSNAGSTKVVFAGSVDGPTLNTGTISLNHTGGSGTIFSNAVAKGSFINSGILSYVRFGAGADTYLVLSEAGSAFTNAAGGVVQLSGSDATTGNQTFNVAADSVVNLGAVAVLSNTLYTTTATGGGGALENYGAIALTNAYLNALGGVVINRAGGTILVDGPGTGTVGSVLTNFGTYMVRGSFATNRSQVVAGVGGVNAVMNGGTNAFGKGLFLDGGMLALDPASRVSGVVSNRSGTISLVNASGVDVKGNWKNALAPGLTNMVWLGTNTLRLDNSSTTNAGQDYVFNTGLGLTNYTRLEMVNGTTLWQGGSLTIGANGTMLASNTTATIQGYATNSGRITVVNALATWASNVVLNGGVFVTQNATNQFNGGLSMSASQVLTFTSGNSRVEGAISNSGTMNAVNANVTFGGPVVISGNYVSDPSTNTFTTNVTVTASGALVGSNGDLFVFQKDFLNQSTNALFSLSQAAVLFSNGPNHLLSISNSGSVDLGHFTNFGMVASNFAIGQFSIASGDRVTLAGNKDSRTNALYVGWLDIQGTFNTNSYTSVTNALVLALNLPNINLYYDVYNTKNDWLTMWLPPVTGAGYDLWGGGLLLPIPEPSPILAVGAGLGLLAFLRRRQMS